MFPAKFCDVVAAGLFCENIQNLNNDIWTTIFDKYSGDLFPRKNKTKALPSEKGHCFSLVCA